MNSGTGAVGDVDRVDTAGDWRCLLKQKVCAGGGWWSKFGGDDEAPFVEESFEASDRRGSLQLVHVDLGGQ